MKKTIYDVQMEIIQEFEVFSDWVDKYTYVMSYSTELERIPDELKTEAQVFKECTTRVWVKFYYENNSFFFQADSESMIIRGILALLQKVLNNNSADEILDSELFFMKAIGMEDNLPPERVKGIKTLILRIREFAGSQKGVHGA